ncbi:MAG: ribosome maturation factor RimM [Gemmatimonadetes bacterium]|nr:ribosome maturation factor RimM [Gemmatimonadota bacterium]
MGEHIVVGKVRRAHGVRGAWAVESVTDAPDAIFASGAVLFAGDRDGNPVLEQGAPVALHIEDGRPMNREWLVRVREVTDRDVADTWRGRCLLADADTLPEPDEDEIYIRDILGMQVAVEGLGVVGTVRDVYDAPQGFILEVETATGRPLVPWHDDLVQDVDEEARVITLAHLDGLLDG